MSVGRVIGGPWSSSTRPYRSRPPGIEAEAFAELVAALSVASRAGFPFDLVWPVWLDKAVACFEPDARSKARLLFAARESDYRAAYAREAL